MLRLSDEVADGIAYMNEAKNMMYLSFYGDELQEEGEFKGFRKFDDALQFVVMWSNNIVDLIDGKTKSVPIKKKDKNDDTVQGYLSINANKTLIYAGFFSDEVHDSGDFKGKRKFDKDLQFIIRWASDVKDMIDGKVKSVKIYKKRKP